VKIETLAHGYGLIEGPRVDEQGNLFFSDVTNGGVFRLAPDGTITVIPKRRGVGGIALHAAGGVVVSGRNVCHVRDGDTRVLFERSEGVLGFNDLFTDSAGRIYVGSLRSDPFGAGPRTPGECYRIEAEGRATELYGDVGLTNGIGFGPEGHVLYHADTAARAVIVHDIENGRAVRRRSFSTNGDPDGLAVDERGFVWVALFGAGKVACHSPSGELDDVVEVPASAVTSVCFGRDRELYVVTADNTEAPERQGTIFRTHTPWRGMPVPLARI
jgi:xylono-1,5-lactonase